MAKQKNIPEITVVFDNITTRKERGEDGQVRECQKVEYQLEGWYNNSSLAEIVGTRLDSRTLKSVARGIRFTCDMEGKYIHRAYLHKNPVDLYQALTDWSEKNLTDKQKDDPNMSPSKRLTNHAVFLASLVHSLDFKKEFPTGVSMRIKPLRAFRMVQEDDKFVLQEIEDNGFEVEEFCNKLPL